jgi:hypothetical protein
MLVWTLLIVLFWSVVPGLIIGWMRKESGRSFYPGLLVGLVFGPLGIIATLFFIYFDERAARRRRPKHGRAVRVFYEVPVVGRLHVSTVWALAGLTTFMCLWMVGGIGYESYRSGLLAEEFDHNPTPTATTLPAENTRDANAPTDASASAAPPAESKPSNSAQQANASSQARAALLGSIPAPPGQANSTAARSENPSTQPTQPTSTDALSSDLNLSPPNVIANAPAAAPKVEAAGKAPPARAAARSREAAVSEVTRSLASAGHRVHAALSGDAQTTTLSLTGATLTREVGNQLLADRRLRDALKAAGVRIVVMVNGQESWTYIL